jgi:16S rRNA (cytosine1402-N4)-methyltransferase
MQEDEPKSQTKHLPVLLEEVLSCLSPEQGNSYLDLTAGYGGHAQEVIAITKAPRKAILVDRDKNAINYLQERFEGKGVEIRWQDFLSASQELKQTGKQFDLILADLGVSSPHLNEANRGFALQNSGPLDMRMDQSQALSADIIVNQWDEAQLVDILRRYGEEPKALKIARLLVANRPLKTTTELAKVVSQAWPGRSRVHPATRTFQALRIAVNDELGLLELILPIMMYLLTPGGSLELITFHSLEDRLVKRFFASQAGERYDANLRLVTKRPITASPPELVLNPRARSAKLRAAVKI